MTKIRFENSPSTNTPINVENLNKLNNVGLNGTGTCGVADTIIITKVIGYK